MTTMTPTEAEVNNACASIRLGDLSSALAHCLPFVDTTKDRRFQMSGVWLGISADGVTLIASDGRRICRQRIARIDDRRDESASIIIYPERVRELIRLGKAKRDAEQVAHMVLRGERLHVGALIKGESKEVVANAMSGRFPRTDDLFLTLYPTYAEVAIVDADDLRAALESIWGAKPPKKAERGEPDRSVLVVARGGTLHLSGMIRGVEHRASIQFKAGGVETRAVTLDVDYALDFLRTLRVGAGAIGLHIQHQAKMVGISWGPTEVVIMPKGDGDDKDPIGKAGRRFLESLDKPTPTANPPEVVLAESSDTPEVVSVEPARKPRRGVNAYLAETIDFGGVETPRGEVIANMQAEGHPQRCIDAYLVGADSRKATLEQIIPGLGLPARETSTVPIDARDVQPGMTLLAGIAAGRRPLVVSMVEETRHGTFRVHFGDFFHSVHASYAFSRFVPIPPGAVSGADVAALPIGPDGWEGSNVPLRHFPAVSAPTPLATLSDDDLQTVTIVFHALPVPVVGVDCGYCGSAADTARMGGRPATADQLWKLGRKRLDREQAEARRAAEARAELMGRLYAADERLAILDPEEWARELELDRRAEATEAGQSRALVILPETDRTRGKAPSGPATAFTMDIDGKAYHVEPRPALPGLRAYSVQRGESDYAVSETTSGRAHCECADFLFRHVDLPHSDGCRHIKRLVALGLLTNRFPTPSPTTRPADADPGVIRQTDYVTTPTMPSLSNPAESAPAPDATPSVVSVERPVSIPETVLSIRWRGMRYQRNGVAWKTSAGSALAFDEADREHAAGRVAIIDMGSNITAHSEIITGGADSIGDRAQNITDTPVSITPCPRTLSGLIAVVRRSAAPPIAPAFRAAWILATQLPPLCGGSSDSATTEAPAPEQAGQSAEPVAEVAPEPAEFSDRVNYYQAYKAARIERYREYAAGAQRRRDSSYNTAHRIGSFIPMGQPILVGHHSEKRHRRDIARIDSAMRRSCEESRKAAYWAARAAAAESNTAISSRDPEALTLLRARIAFLKGKQDMRKAVNAAHKKYLKNPATLETSGLPDAYKAVVRDCKPAYSWEPHPFPPYQLSNNNANIRRLEERLKDLERRAGTPAAPDVVLEHGTRITEDAERDSVNVEFPGKPSQEMRDKLKSHGFRWSSADCCWYARRSNRAKWALAEIFPELKTATAEKEEPTRAVPTILTDEEYRERTFRLADREAGIDCTPEAVSAAPEPTPSGVSACEEPPAPAAVEPKPEPINTDRDAVIARIKAALKRRSGKTWSVTGGSGTAWGWIEINVPPARRTWQDVQTTTPEPPAPEAVYRGMGSITPHYRVEAGADDPIRSPADDPWAREAVEKGHAQAYNWEVESPGEKYGHASPAERIELGQLLGLGRAVHHQGHSIAASSGHRREYVDRAEGREPTECGEQYWD